MRASHEVATGQGALVYDAAADLELLCRHAAPLDRAAHVRARIQHVAGPDAETVHVKPKTAQVWLRVGLCAEALTRTQRARLHGKGGGGRGEHRPALRP